MSLMRTLAKVAIGVAVAKGASSMMKNRAGGAGAAQGGLGGLLGGLASAAPGGGTRAARSEVPGGLQDMLGGLLGGAQSGSGGLGNILEGLGGGSGGKGGLQDVLGGLAGAAGAGGLLGGLAGAAKARPKRPDADFGAVLNSQFDQNPEPAIEPSADQEFFAALLLKAMIQAAKSDGQLDPEEEEKLMGHLREDGEVDESEVAFVRGELTSPVDVRSLADHTPAGAGPQVYAVSLLAIDLDSQAEAQYLHQLAEALSLGPDEVNQIHGKLGVPSLYA